MGLTEHWLAAASVVPQESGPDWLGIVDQAPWTEGRGYYRGFRRALPLDEALTARFAAQLCIVVMDHAGGIVRFYGAAVTTEG